MNPFNIPNLPTDNLYKFYALSGIIGIIAVNTTCIYIVGKSIDLMIQAYSSVNLLEAEQGFISEDLAELDNKKATLEKTVLSTKKLSDSIHKQIDSIKFQTLNNPDFKSDINIEVFENQIAEVERRNMQSEDEWEEYNKLILLVKEKNRNMVIKAVEIQNKVTSIEIYFIGGLVITIVGIYLIWMLYDFTRNGFQQWKKLVQNPIDRKMQLEIKSLEAELKKNKSKK